MKRRPPTHPRAASRTPQGTASAAARSPGTVRIVGGRWRGTKLAVPDRPGLRPTSDRVRETLFNWLLPMLPGARVLDAFAGSGALGLEAVSRGAAEAVLIERDPGLAQSLRATVERLHAADRVQVVGDDALRWLARTPSPASGQRFDLVFLDPPFAGDAQGGLWARAWAAAEPWLTDEGWLYLESPNLESPNLESPNLESPNLEKPSPETPNPARPNPDTAAPTGDGAGTGAAGELRAGWALHREGRTRDVRYALYRRSAAARDGAAPVHTPACG